MARAGKPVKLLKLEGKSNKTKAELEFREKQEESMMTKQAIKAWPEVWNDPVARREMTRLRNLLKIIGKNDALYEGIINRYCLLHSECFQIEERINRLTDEQDRLTESFDNDNIEAETYHKLQANLGKQILSWDAKLMEKRRMMLQIEKENVMTILASLRAIPKKPPEDKPTSQMGKFLDRKRSG
jgi:predicted nuclease with TOPRIM domain